MPRLDKLFAFFTHLVRDDGEIARGKAEIARHLHIGQSELYRISVPVDMNMGRLVALVAEEIEAIALPSQNGRRP